LLEGHLKTCVVERIQEGDEEIIDELFSNRSKVNEKIGGIMMKTVTLKVEGMSCNHCVNAIKSNVGKLQGFQM
jgi:hypothetical protein